MFEERMAALEGAEDAFATASGMAAVNGALFCQLQTGDHVVSSRALFGSCLYIIETVLPRFGINPGLVATPRLLDLDDVSPQVGQEHTARRPSDDVAEFEHAKASKW